MYIAFIVLWISAVIGWIANIIQIVGSISDPTITPMLVIKCIGIFAAPLGAVLGWIGIF